MVVAVCMRRMAVWCAEGPLSNFSHVVTKAGPVWRVVCGRPLHPVHPLHPFFRAKAAPAPHAARPHASLISKCE